MLAAYFDDSGTDEARGSSHVVVAGYLARENDWLKFESSWQQTLDSRLKGKPFHMAEFLGGHGVFKGMERGVREDLLQSLLTTIRTYTIVGVSSVIPTDEYGQIVGEYRSEGSPFTVCALGCMIYMKIWQQEHNLGGPCAYIFEDGTSNRREVAEAWDRVKKGVGINMESIEPDFAPDSFAFAPKAKLPTQAADILAWYTRRTYADKNWKDTHTRFSALLDNHMRHPHRVAYWDAEHLKELRRVSEIARARDLKPSGS
jgi:hypothetical protein